MESNPTTVRGWLETLPEIQGMPNLAEIYHKSPAPNSLEDALLYMANESGDDFYYGIRRYIKFKELPTQDAKSLVGMGSTSDRYNAGYNAAKAAYEAQERRKSEVRDCCRCGSTLPETEFEGFEQTCNDCLKSPKGDWVGVGPIEKPAYQVKEVWEQTHDALEGKTLVDNHLLSLLQEKAAKWDELMETLKRLKIC